MIRYLSAFFFILAIYSPLLKAQNYDRVTILSGSQTVRNNTVVVTSNGSVANTGLWAECEANPYAVGLNYNGVSGSYTHTFATPVTHIKLPVTSTHIGEINTLYINGTKYVLTADNIDSLKTCDTHYYLQNIATATGELVFTGPIVGPVFYGRFGSGTITVYAPTGMLSVRLENNGIMAGSCYGFFFKGIPLLTNNNSDSICAGDTLKLWAEPEIPNAQYSWTGPDGFSAMERNPVLANTTHNSEGLYMATVTTAYDTTIDSTWVKFKPSPNVQLISNQPLCQGDTLHIFANSDIPGTSYSWEGPDNFTSSSSEIIIPHVQQLHAGSYSVMPKAGSCQGPKVAIQVGVYETALGPIQTVQICQGDSFVYKGVVIKEEGLYADTLKGAGNQGCDSVIFVNLVQNPLPPVKIVYQQRTGLCQGDSIQVAGYGATNYSWNYNQQFTGEENTLVLALAELQNTLILTGKDEHNCSNSDTMIIYSQSCCDIWMPNAFSPNHDGHNDEFGPLLRGIIQQYKLNIYNRWGQLVFTSSDPRVKWNGYIRQQPAAIDTYYYGINAKCFNNEDLTIKGSFLLVR